MEDFGYSKNQKQPDNLVATKKFFLIAASLFSIACFVYITINAYHFIYRDKDANVETIKSPEDQIKVIEDGAEKETEINRSVYDDIFGNKKESLKNVIPKIRVSPQPALPPKNKELVRENIDEAKENETKINNNELTKKVVEEEKQAAKPSENASSKKQKPTQKAKKKSIRVQLAAMTSKKAADDYWVKLNDSHSKLLSDLDPFIEEVDLGKRGTFYRLQIGNFFNQVDAEEFCNKYVAKAHKTRADCIIVE